MGRVSLGHYLVGLEGLALLRTFFRERRADSDARVRELTSILAHPDEPPLALEVEVGGEDVVGGYQRWATTYDAAPNPLIHLEEPVLHALIDPLPPGVALDAACGTGRHTDYLHARGHRVIGVDVSPAMLEKARARVPAAEFRHGGLEALPLADASVDLAVCALALTHCADLAPPVREIARVVRPGGRVLISDYHPFQMMIGGTAFFIDAQGQAGQVHSHAHTHGAYLVAFQAAGLVVESCLEPPDGEDEVVLKAGGMMPFAPDACRAALAGLPGVLVWNLTKRTRDSSSGKSASPASPAAARR